METLRQMVAADVGITLMPILSVKPPIAKTGNLLIKRFAQPVPSRTIAMVWRSSSALSDFIRELADCFKTLPVSLFKM
jgi:LysR family hydrogen peroxide-inducible transcriptional activator